MQSDTKIIYVKSFRAGLVVSILSVFFLTVGYGIFAVLFHKPGPVVHVITGGAEVGWDLRSLFEASPTFWIVPLIIFSAGFILGFYWEFRKALH